MPSVIARINVSVDSGDLTQRLGGQIAQITQIAELIIQLAQDPPNDVGDLLSLAGNLPLPDFDLGGDFGAAIDGLRDALPDGLTNITGSVESDLGNFAGLITQLQELLADAVKIAAAVEKLGSLDFSCPTSGGSAGSGSGGGGGGGGDPANNPAADRLANTAQQTQAANAVLDKIPASPTVGGLLEFLLPIIDNRPHLRIGQIALPVLDDILDPLRTLARWATLAPANVGAEIQATLNALAARLRNAARIPLDDLLGGLGTLQPQLDIPAITNFAEAYRIALGDLNTALGASADTSAAVAAMNVALDDPAASALLGAWQASVAAETRALTARVRGLPELLLDRITHLLTLLEPVELPANLVNSLPRPQPTPPETVASIQQAVQPVIDFLEEIISALDFSAIQGPVTDVATQAQSLADSVEQGLTGIALEVQGLFDDIATQLAVIDLVALREQLVGQIEDYGSRIERELGNAVSPAAQAITQAVQTLSDALDAFDPEQIIDALRGVLQAVTDVLTSGEVADAINEVRGAVDTLITTLEQLSFAPVTDEVVGLIEQMAQALRQLTQTDLNDAAKAALSVALQVLPDDLKPVTDPLLDEFDGLIEQGPVPLLEKIAEKPAELTRAITRFRPGDLIGDSLGAPYRQALDQAEAYRPSALFEALEAEFAKARAGIVREVAPGRALQLLAGPFQQLRGELTRYSPDTLLAPLEARIEGAIQDVVEASPVDEIFAAVDRVFAQIENALSVPQAVVGTLDRVNNLLTALADPDSQIDGWRDGLLDKLLGVTDPSGIQSAITDLSSAVGEAAHAALLQRFDDQTQTLRDALAGLNPGARVTQLVTAWNQARQAVNALPDGAAKTAAQAALERFDPSRADPLRLSRELNETLNGTRQALSDLEDEWQGLVEDGEGLLAEVAALTPSTSDLRALLASAVEPLLAPLRYLGRLLASLQPAVAGMLAKLTELVDTLTSGVAALLTGPGSLQSITDAVQQVVDTLRNIDLSFLRQGLQTLYIQLLDQFDALDPSTLGAELDAVFEDLLAAIDLTLILTPATLTTLDDEYETTLDKLRALDPQALVTNVVQPEYDAAVGPLVEAFDLTPAFNALIEFLCGLRDELNGELGRVNTAYQGLRSARPSLGDVNVNISL